MDQTSDKILFDQIRQGNKEVFDAMFKNYYVQLCRFALTFTKDQDTAEELVQETFVTLWKKREGIKILTSLKSYLYTSVKNHIFNYFKSQKIRKEYETNYFEKKEQTEEFEDSSSTEMKNIILKAVQQLPEKCRDVFMLSRMEGLSYEEISNYLSISAKTVENQMAIAFKKLRVILYPDVQNLYET